MRLGDRIRKKQDFVVCPRCGLKNLASADCCPDCGLVFSRLKIATNRDAKKKILRGDRDYIIRTSTLPSDVSRIKLLLLTILAGIFGAHCFYVGRYLRGSVILLNTIALIMYVVFNTQLVAVDDGKLISALATISGLILFLWAFDLIWVIIKKFKVPVAIDLKAETISHEEENIEKEIIVEDNTVDGSLKEEFDDKQVDNKEE